MSSKCLFLTNCFPHSCISCLSASCRILYRCLPFLICLLCLIQAYKDSLIVFTHLDNSYICILIILTPSHLQRNELPRGQYGQLHADMYCGGMYRPGFDPRLHLYLLLVLHVQTLARYWWTQVTVGGSKWLSWWIYCLTEYLMCQIYV